MRIGRLVIVTVASWWAALVCFGLAGAVVSRHDYLPFGEEIRIARDGSFFLALSLVTVPSISAFAPLHGNDYTANPAQLAGKPWAVNARSARSPHPSSTPLIA